MRGPYRWLGLGLGRWTGGTEDRGEAAQQQSPPRPREANVQAKRPARGRADAAVLHLHWGAAAAPQAAPARPTDHETAASAKAAAAAGPAAAAAAATEGGGQSTTKAGKRGHGARCLLPSEPSSLVDRGRKELPLPRETVAPASPGKSNCGASRDTPLSQGVSGALTPPARPDPPQAPGHGCADVDESSLLPPRPRAVHPRPLVHPSRAVRELYQVNELAGRGAFGDVWACTDRATGDPYACKVVDLAFATWQDDVAREVAVMERLGEAGGHPGVVLLRHVFEFRRKVQMLVEYCEGGDLFRFIRNHGAPPEVAAKVLFSQLASGIEFCHEQGVIHRDIKPENVFLKLTSDSSAGLGWCGKLGDFGVATFLGQGEKTKGYKGTKFYAAPEVVKGQEYDSSADIWSLGVVLFSLVSGLLPVIGPRGEDMGGRWKWMLQNSRAVMLRQVEGGISTPSSSAFDLIESMLAQNPADRPSATQILQHPWLAMQALACSEDGGIPSPSSNSSEEVGGSLIAPSLSSDLWRSPAVSDSIPSISSGGTSTGPSHSDSSPAQTNESR